MLIAAPVVRRSLELEGEQVKVLNEKRNIQMRDGNGFIAALDQSGGSTPKALGLYGIKGDEYASEDEMFELIHEMRVRIIDAPDFNNRRIIAAILFEKTMENQIHGIAAPAYLWEEKGVLPFLKVDDGLMDDDDGVQLMKPISKLDGLLDRAVELGIYGTKMRSVINSPSATGIKAVVEQQFEIAGRIIDRALVPIVEPEVSIKCPDKSVCEDMLHTELLSRLDGLPEGRNVALKLTLPESPNRYGDLIAHDRVVRVSALSGGYSRTEACSRLESNNGMIASFSRALTEGLRKSMSDADFNKAIGDSIAMIFKASRT